MKFVPNIYTFILLNIASVSVKELYFVLLKFSLSELCCYLMSLKSRFEDSNLTDLAIFVANESDPDLL